MGNCHFIERGFIPSAKPKSQHIPQKHYAVVDLMSALTIKPIKFKKYSPIRYKTRRNR